MLLRSGCFQGKVKIMFADFIGRHILEYIDTEFKSLDILSFYEEMSIWTKAVAQ